MQLIDSVTKIPFIGPEKAKRLAKLGIATVEDLLYHFPARYEDYSKTKPIAEIDSDSEEKVTIQGKVWQIGTNRTKTGKLFTLAVINDETGSIQSLWWNQPWIANSLKPEKEVSISGKLGWWTNKLTFINPEWEIVKFQAPSTKFQINSKSQILNSKQFNNSIHTGRLVPIYPETEGISSKWLRSRINSTINNFPPKADQPLAETISTADFLPAETRRRENLVDLKSAINQIHFPQNWQEVKSARQRLGFDELFLLQLKAARRRANWEQRKACFSLEMQNAKYLPVRQAGQISNFIKSLPFELTNAQKKAVKDILDDLTKDNPMNRLLQGDVGSGKTVVAAIAMYAAHLAGFQSALMAPTDVLANQHFQTINAFLSAYNISVELHTSAHKVKSAIKNSKINNTKLDIAVGTQALIFKGIQFDKLGLVIIDEQHRFGVRQRAKLVKKAKKGTPHVLTMTATPIPRSVALTIYGDQDLSIIDEMPPGRVPVETWVVPPAKRLSAYNWIKQQGTQTFIIYPLIDPSESETMADVKAATAEFEKLKQYVFFDLNVGLLHGRMKSQDKAETLEKFRQGKLDILIATPVVEVGIDVASATIIVIEAAERFGLASLHQLRGRVGRGGQQAYCLLFTESKDTEVTKRLKYMEKEQDGMKLAEFDLERRGPGELFGVKQHGFADLKIAKLTDLELVEKTKKAAGEILPNLEKLPKLCGKIGIS